MLRLFFWNLNGKALQDRVAELARTHDADIVILVECSIAGDAIVQALNRMTGSVFHKSLSLLETVAVYTRLGHRSVSTLVDDEAMRLTFQQIWLPSGGANRALQDGAGRQPEHEPVRERHGFQ